MTEKKQSPRRILLRAAAEAISVEVKEMYHAAREDIRSATEDLFSSEQWNKARRVIIPDPPEEEPDFSDRPEWYQRAIAAGRDHPCAICEASGALPTDRNLELGAQRRMPFIKCYHCHGSGDESEAVRRNGGGRRPVR